MYDLVKIGEACRHYRKFNLKIPQKEAADIMGYSATHISNFERGKVNNILILLWYISQGFDVKKVI